MQGYVLVYRPASRQGTLLTDAGEILNFTASASTPSIEGGDRVSLNPAPAAAQQGAATLARDVQVLMKWPHSTAAAERTGFGEFFSLVQLDRAAC